MSLKEQDVVNAKREIATLKSIYLKSMSNYLEEDSLENLLDFQSKATQYFNYHEALIGDSHLLGAHDNPLWVQGFAEDCLAILELMPKHFEVLSLDFSTFDENIDVYPNATAYANMQRFVKRYVDSELVSKVEADFVAHKLPIYGFKNEEPKIMSKKTQTIVSFIFGVVFIIVLLVTAFVMPNPSSYQYTVFRIVLALAGGGVVAVFPGFIEVKFESAVRAGGALAVFAVIYFFSPAALG